MYSGGREKIAFLSGPGAVTADRPRTLPGGGNYFTDGGRVVFFFSTRPRTFADVEILQWESIPSQRSVEAGKDGSGAGN